uniref:Non-structural maintenance of chromosomes element 4 n=1 Tax=Parascaris univalens TaxID=6257 RepID=A0A915AIR4_PARUN
MIFQVVGLFRLHINFCIMDHSVSSSIFDGTLCDEEIAQLRSQLEQINKDMNAIERAAWRVNLMERYDRLSTRYNEMADYLAENGNTSEDHEDWTSLKEELEATLASADKEFKEMADGREVLADAQLMRSISNLLCSKVLSAVDRDERVKRCVRPEALATMLIRYYRVDETSIENATDDESSAQQMWLKLAELDVKSEPIPFRALLAMPILDEVIAVQRNAPRRERLMNAPTVQLQGLAPQEVHDDAGEGMPQILDRICSCLRGELGKRGTDHIGYYEFCLDPIDFGRTVENMFHMSFLLKDNRHWWNVDPMEGMITRRQRRNVLSQSTRTNGRSWWSY